MYCCYCLDYFTVSSLQQGIKSLSTYHDVANHFSSAYEFMAATIYLSFTWGKSRWRHWVSIQILFFLSGLKHKWTSRFKIKMKLSEKKKMCGKGANLSLKSYLDFWKHFSLHFSVLLIWWYLNESGTIFPWETDSVQRRHDFGFWCITNHSPLSSKLHLIKVFVIIC